MYIRSVFLISVLLVANARCDCDEYIECIGEFIRDLFYNFDSGNGDVDANKNVTKTEVFELNHSESGGIEGVLSDITSLIKGIDLNIKHSDVVTHENNKTKIVVKTFELDDDFNNENVTKDSSVQVEREVTTTEFNIIEELSLSEVTTTVDTTIGSNYNVIPLKSVKENEIVDLFDVVYSVEDENSTDYANFDYLEMYKDFTLEPVEYLPTVKPNSTEYNELRAEIDRQENEIGDIIEQSVHALNNEALTNIIENVSRNNIEDRKPSMNSALFPWVAAIFLKNDTKGSQFDYFCDGAILNHLTILTAARCVHNGNETYNGENFIVILGKTSLQASGDNEKILRVKTIKVHENFTIENGEGKNDLAVLILEESISFDEAVSPANLTSGDELNAEYGQATDDVTTAWSLGGDLTVIYFDKEKSKACGTDNKVENTLCATYGDDVPLCPSYGGLIVTTRGEKLYLTGIRTGNPLKRGLCFSKDVTYTALQNYTKWISDVIEIKYD